MRRLGLILLSTTAFAQTAAPLKITLHDAVAPALNQTPQVILANIGVSQAEQERLIARSTLLPQAGANLNEGVHRVNLEAAIGFKFPGFSQHVGPYWTFQGGVGVNAPLFD